MSPRSKTATKQIALRLDVALLQRIDYYVDLINERVGIDACSRSDAIRALLTRALNIELQGAKVKRP